MDIHPTSSQLGPCWPNFLWSLAGIWMNCGTTSFLAYCFTQNTAIWCAFTRSSHLGCHVGGLLGKEHLESYRKPYTQHWRYCSVEISVVMHNLLCPSHWILLLADCMICWFPSQTRSLRADAFKVTGPRVSKSKVFNLLLISQLPKW